MKIEVLTKFENRPIFLDGVDLKRARAEGVLMGTVNKQGITITSPLYRFLELMAENQTVYNMVMHHFNKGLRMNFAGLRQLMVFLVEENAIQDGVIQEFLTKTTGDKSDTRGFLDSIKVSVAGKELETDMADAQRAVSELPFFRSLNFDLLDLFFQHAKVIRAPPRISICQAGQIQRSLFVLLRGAAGVYTKSDAGKKSKTATLQPGAIFGETGFFLGEARSEDVVTEEHCVLMQIKYVPEVFDRIFQAQASLEISNRLWLVQAMLQSAMFRNVPSDSFHEIVVTGQLKTFPEFHTLLKEGEKAEACYILVKGTLAVTRKNVKLTQLKPGEIIGETGLMLNGGKASESVYTESECKALEISVEQFHELLASNFNLGIELERLAATRMAIK